MFTLPELPYPTNALEPHIDKTTMEIHHDKHHGTYAKNLNDALAAAPQLASLSVEQLLSDLTNVPEEIRTKVRNNGGGHYNHSLFWQMMTPGGSPLEGPLLEGINSKFGSLDVFKEKFTAAGIGRFGSGWVWLTKDLQIIDTPNQDNPLMEGKQVVLGVDVWEHAYYLKYQNRRADYLTAWWNVVNWKFVSDRFSSVLG
jgi:Fe-Mn family superoxide dismutase